MEKSDRLQATLAMNYINIFSYDPDTGIVEFEFGWGQRYDNERPRVWTRAILDTGGSGDEAAIMELVLRRAQRARQVIEERTSSRDGE